MAGPSTWRQRGFLAAAGFLVVVGVVTAVVTVAGVGGGTSTHPAGVEAARSAARASGGGCRMPAGDQRVPLTAPAAHWDKVGSYRVPGSTLVGPGVVDGHVRRCYAHSPTGAVFAAYGFVAAQDTWPTDVAMLRALTAPSDVRDEALRRGGSPPSDPNVQMEVIGFRVTSYSARAATALLGVRVAPTERAVIEQGQSGSQLVAAPVRLLWVDGDWKVSVDAEGFKPEPLDSMSTLVPWSAP